MKKKISRYLSFIPFLLLFSGFMYSQTVTTIDEYVVWDQDKMINTVIEIADGGTLHIEEGVNVRFNWADLNNDLIGDFKIVVKDGGRLYIDGTAEDPVILEPIVCPVPNGSEHSIWSGIIFENDEDTDDYIQYAEFRKAHIGIQLYRNVSLGCLTFDDIGGSAVIVQNFDDVETTRLNNLDINNADSTGIFVYKKNTNLKYCAIDSTQGNGIEIYAENITIDWCEIRDINGTGIYNGADGTNTIIMNSYITGCAGSGIFNLDGTITQILNTKVSGNSYHGIVNSSGYVWIERSEISGNASMGIVSAGNSQTTSTYVTDINNISYGYRIFPDRLESDLLILAGTAESETPEVIFRNSNIYGNDTTDSYQVYTTADNFPVADFTENWWGINCCVSDLVYFTSANSIDYTNWLTTGTISNATAFLVKSLLITEPANNDFIIENQLLTIKWNSSGFIPRVKVYVMDSLGVIQPDETAIVCNSGSYTFEVSDNSVQFRVVTYPDESVVSNVVLCGFTDEITVTSPAVDDVLLGGTTHRIKWVAPWGVSMRLEYCLNGTDANPNNWWWKVMEDGDFVISTDAYFDWVVPNDTGAYKTARIRVIDNNGLLNTFVSDTFTIRRTPPSTPDDVWYFDNTTGHNMTIMFEDVQLLDEDDLPIVLAEEDMYIGAFYLDNVEGLTCVGYSYLRYNPLNATNPTFLTVWGDDPTTTDVVEAVPEGGSLVFKIWRSEWSADDPEEEELVGDINDRTASTSTGTINYQLNDVFTDPELLYQRGGDDPPVVGEDGHHEIILRTGWSYISSHVNPVNNNDLDWSITAGDNLLSPPVSELQGGIDQGIAPDPMNFLILKNGDGNVYWVTDKTNPNSPVITADMTEWDYREGYYIMMESSSQTDTLKISGTVVVPQETSLSLGAGWNMIPYLRNSAMPIQLAISGIANSLLIAKDQDGNVYWPEQSINSIGDMETGQAYLVKLSESATLVYPANTSSPAKSSGEKSKPEHFVCEKNSDNSAVVGIAESVLSAILEIGDEVAIFGENGKMAGSAVYNGGNTAVVVWGKNAMDNGFGLEIYENFTLKAYSKTQDKEFTLNGLNFSSSGKNYYTVNGISFIESAESVEGAVPEVFMLNQNYPNPFNPTTIMSFSLPENRKVNLAVYNVLGELVSVMINREMEAGNHRVEFNASSLAPGVYFYRLIAGDYTSVKKMTLLK